MSVKIQPYKNQKSIILFLLVFICIGSYVLFQSFDQYIDSTKQSNIYLQRQTSKLNSSAIQRAILIFYPSTQESHFLPEVRWLYRSWVEMMKYESKNWRTDLIIYTGQYSSSFQQLGCVLNRIRTDNSELPQCRVFLYLRILDRHISSLTQQQTLYIDTNTKPLFQIDIPRSKLLYQDLKKYGYIDSVNIIAEAYPTFEYYDFILKTDIDVFLTKQFAKYVPIGNVSLLFGRGGYSTPFNIRRLERIARDMNWSHRKISNIGSTWYGSPYVAQRIANRTLDAMLYLYNNEFTRVEREQKLGTLLWPDWHYGVLSMYGTHLAVNHLLITEKFDIKKADQLLDQSTTSTDQNDLEKNNRLHLHCWHTEKQFSKFQFKADKYNHIHPRTLYNDRSAQAYAMRMALESRLMTLEELSQRLRNVSNDKTNSSFV